MPTVLWATDIHLNTAEPRVAEGFCRQVSDTYAEALLLGGDIAEAPDLEEWLGFLADRITMPILFVLGNHDYSGSDIRSVRAKMRDLKEPRLIWLPHHGVVSLDDRVAIVGHGGWGDGRLGNFGRSNLILSDYVAIRELAESFDLRRFKGDFSDQPELRTTLEHLGDDAATSLRPSLAEATDQHSQVIVLTHVPPFKAACWHDGRIASDEWLPAFTCRAMGDLLLESAKANPDCEITVLCGHTHGHGVAQIAPNLTVYTGEAEHGRVEFRTVSVEGETLTVT